MAPTFGWKAGDKKAEIEFMGNKDQCLCFNELIFMNEPMKKSNIHMIYVFAHYLRYMTGLVENDYGHGKYQNNYHVIHVTWNRINFTKRNLQSAVYTNVHCCPIKISRCPFEYQLVRQIFQKPDFNSDHCKFQQICNA